jgi:hypothetical protein
VAQTVQITPEFKKYRTKITRKDINTQKIWEKFPKLYNSSYSTGCLEDYELSLHVDPIQYPWCATPSENPFWFTKVTFGLSQKYSKNAIQQALQGLNGVRYIADDTIVWGKTRVPRDKNLEALLNRLVIKKLSLNLEKFKFNQPSLWFYGYIQSKYGRLSGDPKQVE